MPVENKGRMKNCYISELCEGARIDDVFLVTSKSLAEARNGSMYIRLQLSDRTGAIDAFKWDASDDLYGKLKRDDFIQVRGAVRGYNGKLQIDIDSFRASSVKVDAADFLPRCARDVDEMLAEMRLLIDATQHPQLRALLESIFKDKDFLTKFSNAPAAMKIHHAYIGGLLEHSLTVAKMCEAICAQYPGVERDLLVTGALLHDIGKTDEFSWNASIKYTDSGHFLGHIVSGTMMLDRAIENIPGFDPLLKLVIEHLIVSHHGQKEYGSPKRPKSLEGVILHFVDDLDAKINTFTGAVKPKPEEDAGHWTERHWVFDRPLFRGLPQQLNPAEAAPVSLESLFSEYDPFEDD